MNDPEAFVSVARALASDIRVEMLRLLNNNNLNIRQMAELLGIPASTAAVNVKVLEDAGLILTELQPGTRGSSMKLCSRRYDNVQFDLLTAKVANGVPVHTLHIDMPLGHYSDCLIFPTCGLLSEKGPIDADDDPASFYHVNHTQAQLIWFYKGYLEYRFPNTLPPNVRPTLLELSFEACSEAPFFRLDWPSDISVWINNVEVGTWTCPGDFGGRRGKLTPAFWPENSTQYGMLKTWQVRENGSFLDGNSLSPVGLLQLKLQQGCYISVKIGIKEDAKNIGGINLFGERFGNYPQNIHMRLDYIAPK